MGVKTLWLPRSVYTPHGTPCDVNAAKKRANDEAVLSSITRIADRIAAVGSSRLITNSHAG